MKEECDIMGKIKQISLFACFNRIYVLFNLKLPSFYPLSLYIKEILTLIQMWIIYYMHLSLWNIRMKPKIVLKVKDLQGLHPETGPATTTQSWTSSLYPSLQLLHHL